MKTDIILAGVGGQGILSIATVIGYAAVGNSLHLKQAEVHGMSQRGGDVLSHLRLSDKQIFSDLIPSGEVDIIISVEPMEALRYKHLLSPNGWLVTNDEPFVNIPNYPNIEDVKSEITAMKNHILIPASKIAKEIGNVKAANIVILGASARYLNMPNDTLRNAVSDIFKPKGNSIVELNLKAFDAGYDFVK
ncbi:indolepyruvate oxidoreductase [Bacteroidia bacterium]|nr:indolepyruvate oxidoreductase [Bacteroidia bacterium]